MIGEVLVALEASIRQSLSNEFAQGGLLLMLVGSVLALCRSVPRNIVRFLERQLIVSVDVMGRDSLFLWLTVWLDSHPYSRRARRLTAAASYAGSPDDSLSLIFSPAPGNHLLWVGGRPVWLSRERKEASSGSGESGGWPDYVETITLRMFGRSPEAAREILSQAMALRKDHKAGVFVARHGEWYRVNDLRSRSLESVILPGEQLSELVDDVRTFFDRMEWYGDRGIPWRRGYLLEGPPGTGKTSTVVAIAGHLQLDVYVCSISDSKLNDERLMGTLLQVRERSIVLLEDVDGIVSGRDMKTEGGVTFSGLLNALDGVAARPGVVTFLTTNHVDRLDPALIRHGRVDRRIHFDLATADQAAQFYRRFFEGSDAPDLATEFGRRYEGRSVAELQHLLMKHADEPRALLSPGDAAA